MRPVQMADIEIAICVLRPLLPQQRSATIARILAQADIADRYRKRLGVSHPDYGNGSLLSACAGYQRCARPRCIDAASLSCLQAITEALTKQCRDKQP